MGQFSWKTSDTNESISNLEPNMVYMLDDKGNAWEEKEYEGYGEFGGKDFFSLVAEMNTDGANSDRGDGIDMYYSEGGERNFDIKCPRLVRDKDASFESVPAPANCPHQGWVDAKGNERDWD